MTGDARPAPAGVNTRVPSIARMYDYYLGGKDNFASDREAADKLLATAPEVRTIARANRAFLGRAVRYLAGEAGIRQFLDIGAGLPTQNNVHEVAQRHAPDARVVYVDNDQVVLAHGRALLATDPRTIVVDGDFFEAGAIIDDPAIRAHLDFDRPIALLLVSILHFLSDADRPYELVALLRDALPAGSHLALTHVVAGNNPEGIARGEAVYRSFNQRIGRVRRDHSDVERFFDGWELLDPGLTYVTQWRPDGPVRTDPATVWMVGGVARKA